MRLRADSLFARLLIAQAGLVLVLGLLLGALFYVERNVTIARLYADRWAPDLARAAGLAGSPTGVAATPVLQRDSPPASARRPWARSPRFTALRRALAAHGLPVDEVRLDLARSPPTVWVRVVAAGRAPLWLGVEGQMVVPEWSARALLALLLSVSLLAGASWVFTRRITRPLEQLRERMQATTGAAAANPTEAQPIVGASREIAAIAAAYTELQARLQRHERERAVLLAGVSHDLRSPLGRIRLAAELLPDDASTEPRRTAIVRNVAQADRLIESFLDYVRSGELAFDETVDIAAAGRSALATFERPANELAIDAPDSLRWPQSNRLLVERLIANLIDNALKHGRLPVRLRIGADPHSAWIEVIDHGDGIPPAQQAPLQEAFTRGDASRAGSGSGLGLAIVRQVVARLGGQLSFEREFERDSVRHRVRVSLPLQR